MELRGDHLTFEGVWVIWHRHWSFIFPRDVEKCHKVKDVVEISRTAHLIYAYHQ